MSTSSIKSKKREVIPIEQEILEWAKNLGYPYQNQLYIADNSAQISEDDLKRYKRKLCYIKFYYIIWNFI